MGNTAGTGQAGCGMDVSGCHVRKVCLEEEHTDFDLDADVVHDCLGEEAVCLAEEGCGGVPVYLNVYHLTNNWSKANKFSKPLGLGGAFHAGVEVHGTEYTFGLEGITQNEPQKCEFHIFHESVYMGETRLTQMEVAFLLRDLGQEWRGAEYDLLDRNCCNFSEEFCNLLTGESLPAWVSNLSRIASSAAATVENSIDVKRLTQDLLRTCSSKSILTPLVSPKSVVSDAITCPRLMII
mmetsp:Transcript_94353/g.177594  ORF Transcript_94353/g.177594 Transcript_94353/m.177594 type:complete len:238 (-) Transcript_94353:14-727(-)